LSQYPNGKFIALAKTKLNRLKEARAASELQDQQVWNTAQQENSQDSYVTYLSSYPQGQFATLAHARIDKIKQEAAAEAKQKREAEEAAVRDMQPGKVFRDCPTCPEMVVIPAGSMNLVSNSINEDKNDSAHLLTKLFANVPPSNLSIISEANAAEERQWNIDKTVNNPANEPAPKPTRNIVIKQPFAMGKYDVTQAEWRAVMGSNPSKFSSCGDNCPVEQVSWNDVQEFIQKLNAKTGKQYRLPNEEEWEYACYGGSQTEYCGGNDSDAVAWHSGTFGGNSNGKTHPVGQKQANGYGLYDMSGNVWQWMANEYNGGRALRGGSWSSITVLLRASLRINYDPSRRLNNLGFRLARTLP
jgi:formylglycine-generating enzyme required for sulfatase activity